ncbi:MAG: hypothetical protein RL685_5576 [Pseudomonadota bacterium]
MSSATATESSAGVERRFTAQQSPRLALGVSALGCAGLGAGVFGLWLAPEAISGSGWLLVGGLLVAAVGGWLLLKEPPSVRVGALGVTLGEPHEAQCLPWCDIQRIHVAGEELLLETARAPLRVSLASHGRAAARIVAEAAQRIAPRLDLSPKAHERLPALSEADGEVVPAGRLQVAGRKCLASGSSITFESDARLCDQCAALYHRQHVPAECQSCGRGLEQPRSAAVG